jgi:hypothetical protein
MMSQALANELYHKNRKAIKMVQDHIKVDGRATMEGLMSAYGWSRTKAHSTLQTMWLLGILNPEKQKEKP